MMDGGAANYGAARYPGRSSNCSLDDKLFNLMHEMNNAVPLILHPFHPKGKMLCWAFELNSAAAAAETWGLKGHIMRYGRIR